MNRQELHGAVKALAEQSAEHMPASMVLRTLAWALVHDEDDALMILAAEWLGIIDSIGPRCPGAGPFGGRPATEGA